MNLVTAEVMRQLDRAAIEGRGIPGDRLMENAGSGIAQRLLRDFIDTPQDMTVAVFCGKGNNGGDGFVVARHLHEAGCAVTVYFIGPVAKLSADAHRNYDRALKIGIAITEIDDPQRLPNPLNCQYVIDAIFGTGFSGAPRGISADIIDYINAQEAEIISVDLPSGLNADTGTSEGVVVRADVTYTLALPKPGLYVSPGRELAGHVEVVPIGIPDDVVASFDLKDELLTEAAVTARLPHRPPDGHKGTFGRLFVLAGSTGMTGAASLTALSALRAGCGIVTVGTPKSMQPVLAIKLTEALTHPLPDVKKGGKLALRGLGEIRQLIDNADAAVIGPGIGQHHETKELILRLIPTLTKPSIIDADGLNACAEQMEVFAAAKASLVITPHPGEFARLNGEKPPAAIQARFDTARAFAEKHKLVLVLKGSPTIVASPEGACYLNPTGNNGMATGGSGDVLSGLIGSFLAQGLTALDAALCGVYIHGFAGDLAADELTPRAMIAGDIIDFFPSAFEWLE